MPARVLIVDPDRTNALGLARVLVARGHEIALARNADEALAFCDFEPDVVATELHLPGASGLELVAALQERGVDARAVLMASSPSFADCREAWKTGATEFLAKPVDEIALVRAVDAALDRGDRSKDNLELRGRTSTDEVVRAVRAVVAFALRCGALPSARARLGSAVAEILDNAHRHAYGGGAGDFRISAHCDDDAISVRITDGGPGFDTVRARLELPSPTLPASEALPGGLARAASLVEALSVESSSEGTCVTLRVAMTHASFDCEALANFSDADYLDPAQAKHILHAARRGRSVDPLDVPPSIAVVIGRLLAGATPSQLAQAALWS